MIKSVIVISNAESFIVRGLEMKLSGIDVKAVFCPCNEPSIMKMERDAELFILYMEDYIYENQSVLQYLGQLCQTKNKMIALIGSKADYDFAMKTLRQEVVWEWFERPLDMDGFLKKVQAYSYDASVQSRKKDILIVDDDLDYMHMIREWLKDDYKVSMVNSGTQAITWLAKNKVDLILLDYEMPVTSGPQVLEMLKSEKDTRDIPVMFLTGKSDRASIMKVLELKPTGYLLKSINRGDLIMKLREFFG